MKKIEAQKQVIAELEDDIAIWMKRKSLLQSSKDNPNKLYMRDYKISIYFCETLTRFHT